MLERNEIAAKSGRAGKRQMYGVGIVSILLIFVVLVFTTFSILSLVSARADMRLTEKNKEMVTNYYTASNKAVELLEELSYLRGSGAQIADNTFTETAAHTISDDGDTYSFKIAVGSHLQLSVIARYTGAQYEILQYKVIAVNTGEEPQSGVSLLF